MRNSMKFINIMLVIMTIVFLSYIVFKDEIQKSNYQNYFNVIGVIVIVLGFISVILYYISKKNKK